MQKAFYKLPILIKFLQKHYTRNLEDDIYWFLKSQQIYVLPSFNLYQRFALDKLFL
jgi:hypothetical protein